MKNANRFFLFLIILVRAHGSDLEPLNPLWHDSGRLLAIKDVLLGQGYFVGMVAYPSFKTAYAIEHRYEKIGGKDVPVIQKVTSDIDDFSSFEPWGEARSRKWKIQIKKKQFSEQRGNSLFAITVGIARQAKYPEGFSGGLDGTTYLFSADRYAGKGWCPSGDAGKLVELWELASQYIEVNSLAEEDALTAKIDTMIKTLDAYVPKKDKSPTTLPTLDHEEEPSKSSEVEPVLNKIEKK